MKSVGVTVSNRGYIVLPGKLRKEMNLKPGTKVLLTREKDKTHFTARFLFYRETIGINGTKLWRNT